MNEPSISVMMSGPGISVEEAAPLSDAAALDELRKLVNNNFKHLITKAKRAAGPATAQPPTEPPA